jgi:hypothetical protein
MMLSQFWQRIAKRRRERTAITVSHRNSCALNKQGEREWGTLDIVYEAHLVFSTNSPLDAEVRHYSVRLLLEAPQAIALIESIASTKE